MRTFVGQTRAPIESQLSFRVGGTLVRLPVKVGEQLQAGDLVAALDATDYQIQVQEAQAALVEARARVENAEAEYERVRGLYVEDLVSRSRFDRAHTQRETGRAVLEAAEQRLAMARQRLAYTRLHAPASGAVTDVLVEQGENVQPGQPVVALAAGRPLEVVVVVPDDLVGRLSPGDGARITLAAFPTTALRGTVTEVGAAPRRGGSAFPVTLQLSGAPSEARPGMAAHVTFAFNAATNGTNRVLVPPVAVAEDTEGRFVYVVDESAAQEPSSEAQSAPGTDTSGIVRRRTVETGRLTAAGLEVRRGLQPGEFVVTAGVSQLRPGQRVRIVERERADMRTDGMARMPTVSERR